MKTLQALVKREFWEHRGSMLKTPIVMALFFAFIMVLTSVTGNYFIMSMDGGYDYSDGLSKLFSNIDNLDYRDVYKVINIALYAPISIFGFVMLLISFSYAVGCLYDERKDKSILFWKSLPISDLNTVLSKIIAVGILIPTLYFVAVALFQIFILLFSTVVFWFYGNSGIILWQSSNLFFVIFNSFMTLLITSLWLAPFWSWLMLASSWAKKSAYLWAILPIFLLTIVEGWITHSNRLFVFLWDRVYAAFNILNSNIIDTAVSSTSNRLSIWSSMLFSTEFLAGVLLSAVFLSVSIIVRRYRNEY